MPTATEPDPPIQPGEEAIGRLLEAIDILEAIDHGGLLAALPRNRDDARLHQCGVSLLAVLRRDLKALARDLQAACLVETVLARVRDPDSRQEPRGGAR